ncbi:MULTISPECIES: response regulator [Nostocales]|uniref:LuxR family transcriptional regulator n=3 Tax=Nostocales TaxID=1161 RepID=A0A0C1RDE7_9CYAN|nr:response regulator transcription factor [Tolypothrix bouteillei]KAF3884313.1 response regulator transcription factor [Tolypothrix bouteillei VB521301]
MADLIRVLVVDDHAVVRNGLVLMVQHELGMIPIAEASNGEEAITLFHQHQPDVTLMDLRMPDITGVEAITTIRQKCPEARIIILTTYDGDENIYRGLHAGAKGYILKDAPLDEITKAIRAVHAGKKYIPPEIGAKLTDRINGAQLSDRECEVLRLIAKGRCNREIGEILNVTEGTVKMHVNHILTKLRASDRTQAVVIALKRGIIRM